MYNEIEELAKRYENSESIEEFLKSIDINNVEDHTIRTILRTIAYSIIRLNQELNSNQPQ